MKESTLSNIRFNKHKISTNELVVSIGKCINQVKYINPKYLTMPNVVETYQDKIFELYNKFQKEDMDFWSNQFPLREAIMVDLNANMQVGIYFITEISKIVILFPNMILLNRFLNNRNMKKLSPFVEKVKEMNDYIEGYTIEQNLNTSILKYFNNMEISPLITADKLRKMYKLMKINAAAINMQDKVLEIEDKVLEIIQTKENEWNNKPKEEKAKISMILQTILEKQKESEKKEERTR